MSSQQGALDAATFHQSHWIGETLRHLACRPRLICLCRVERLYPLSVLACGTIRGLFTRWMLADTYRFSERSILASQLNPYLNFVFVSPTTGESEQVPPSDSGVDVCFRTGGVSCRCGSGSPCVSDRCREPRRSECSQSSPSLSTGSLQTQVQNYKHTHTHTVTEISNWL